MAINTNHHGVVMQAFIIGVEWKQKRLVIFQVYQNAAEAVELLLNV